VNVLHIAWRELRAFYSAPIGWLVTCGWLLLSGLFWFTMVDGYVQQSRDLVFNPYGASQMTITDHLLGPWFGNCAVIVLIVAPALSMRLVAEEVKQRTLELLLTSPVSTLEIVLGKYFGALGAMIVLLLGTGYVPIGLAQWGAPDPGALAGGYGALTLLAGAMLAIGMFASAATSSQVVAFVVAFAASLSMLAMSWLAEDPEGALAQASVVNHLTDLFRGAVRLSDVVYFVALTTVALFATHQRLESFRWR
jgi:ABC-2 type transport system permease protein